MNITQAAVAGMLTTALIVPVVTQDLAADLQRAKQKEIVAGCPAALADYDALAKNAASSAPAIAAEARLRADACRGAQPVPSRPQGVTNFTPVPPDDRFAFNATLSPDGTRVLDYWRGLMDARRPVDLGLVERELATGKERRIVGNDPSGVVTQGLWAPDSRRVAYVFGGPPNMTVYHEVRVADPPTGATQTLATFDEARVIIHDWSQKGQIIYSAGNGIGTGPQGFFRVSATGGERERLTALAAPGVAMPHTAGADRVGNTTPDGASIIIANAEHLSLVDLPAGAERVISGGIAPSYPQISPDGKLVAFVMRRDSQWGVYVARLDRLPIQDPVCIATIARRGSTAPDNGRLSWRAGGTVAFDFSDDEYNLYRVDVDVQSGRAARLPGRLTRSIDGRKPAISPDGKQIAFSTSPVSAAPDDGIFVIGADGSRERRVIDRPGGGVRSPSRTLTWLSADEIMFTRIDTDELRMVSVSTGKVSAVPHSQGVSAPAARPGAVGQFGTAAIDYVRTTGEVVYRTFARSLSDGTVRGIIGPNLRDGDMSSHIFARSVSADGSRLAFLIQVGSTYPAERIDLHVSALDGSSDRIIAALPASTSLVDPVTWAPDGKRLLFAAGAGEPKVIDLETLAIRDFLPTPLAVFFGPQQSVETSGWTWSPDGSFVVFSNHGTNTQRLAWKGVTLDAVTKLMTGRLPR